MLVESVIGIVRAVNGLLEKVNAQGQASLVKSGARLQEGDVLTLLSGEAYIQFIHGFPEALALGKPIKLDGVSPTLQNGVEDLNEQLVQEAIAKGIDPSVILDILGSAAAGAVAVGSGGDAFIIDPLFGFGQVTAGYPTGPISFAYEADTQHLFWYVPEEAIAESESTIEPESLPQIPQFNTNQATVTVFEDALPSGGIRDSAEQTTTARASLSPLISSSSEVASSFAFNTDLSVLPKLKSGGLELEYVLSSDRLALSASTPDGADVVRFELTADGQLTQILIGSIDHPRADSDDSEWHRLDLSPVIDVTFTRISDGTFLGSRTLPASAAMAEIQDDVPIARVQLTNNEILLDETIGMKVGDADAANDDFNPTTTADPFNNTYGRPIGLVQNANLLDTSTSEMGGDAKNATMTHLLKITDAVSGLQTTDGTPINLFLEANGDITGRGGDNNAPVLFAIRMNPNTGSITVAQYDSIKQFDTSNYDEAVDLTGRISAVVRVTDGDGDVSNAEIPIGQRIIFEDDGPKADAKAGAVAGAVLDESPAEGGLNNPVTIAASAIAGLFETPDYGADGLGSVAYSLSGADGASTGLWLTGQSGAANEIRLVKVSDTEYEGRVGGGTGTLAFEVTIDSNTGEVTVTQFATLEHTTDGSSAAAHDDALSLGGAAGIFVVQTVTDADGDTDAATSANALNISFEDDGPVASTNKLTGVVDEDGLAGGIAGGTGDVAGQAVAASGNVATLFQSGADAPLSYSLNSSTSGLPALSSGGVALTYAVSGDTLTASANGTDVFTFTLGSNGNYTFTLLAKLDHPAGADENDIAINLGSVIRATDSDGDTVVAAADGLVITVDDDTPVASATKLTGVVDEDGLAGGIAGGTGDVAGQAVAASGNVAALFQSGADAPLSYSLNSSTSGLPALSSGGVALTYAVSGNTLTASAGSTQVFTFTLNANGNYTFTLLAKLDHPAGADENDIAINLGSVIRATDSDGDTVVAAADGLVITVDDDTPVASATKLTGVVDEDGLAGGIAGGTGDVAGQAVAASGNVATLFQSGADAPLSYSLNSSTSGLPALSSGGVALTYAVSGDTLTASANGTDVFTFTLGSNGNYTFTLLAKLDHPAGADENDIAINLGSVIRATDTDGDTVVAAADGLVITVDDDTPVASATKLTGVVDEDGLAGGIAGGTGDVAGQAVAASGNVAALFQSGADAPLSYSLNSSTSGLPALSSGGVALTYAVSGNTLTAS
ncbi:enhanced entry virulence factor RtxA, partial [Legionella pneumophila serogroup 1]